MWLKLWLWLQTTVAKWLGLALAVLGAFAMIRKSGADAERNKSFKRTNQAVRQRDKINRDINRSSDADINKRLSKWDRD